MGRMSACALALAALAALPSPPASQDQPPRPTFKTEANYVRVDVFPTLNGQPVADLKQEDFEILEDKVPQAIDAFQHIAIRGNVPQETRREPNTVAGSRAMMEDPQARLFVVFLDTYHVDVGGSHRIRQPLIDALNRTIGADDLVGVMTPEMSAAEVTFARKTTTIEGLLTRYWPWGERDQLNSKDPEEDDYRVCYPGNVRPSRSCPDQNGDDAGIAAEMIARRREKRTIDALQDLVRYLGGVREERKALLAISEGWLLFKPNARLARPINCSVPGTPETYVDPRTGKISRRDNAAGPTATMYQCDADRQRLAQIDNDRQFLEILDEANRANASFYPIDPRGLAGFDTPLVPAASQFAGAPSAVVPLAADRAMLTTRLNTLRTLAEATDGLAIVDSNDLGAGLKRVVSDLSSYYLLGYYSTGKLDGKFHSVSVRVKRPGVEVRARRGFLAATAAEATAAHAAAAAESPASAAAVAEAHAVDAVIAPLANYERELPLRLLAAAGWKSDGTPAVWVVAEAGRGEDWMGGGEANALMQDASGATVAAAQMPIAPAARSVLLTLAPAAPLPPGAYEIRLRVKGAGSARATGDATRVELAPAPNATGAIFLRRGPTTGNRDVATADLRFRRSDRLTVEVPTAASSGPVSAQLLDRTGKPLPVIPVAASTRVDADGARWHTAQLSLMPLGSGDYVIELTAGSERTLVAFRVVP